MQGFLLSEPLPAREIERLFLSKDGMRLANASAAAA
jgi:hypothetical protein